MEEQQRTVTTHKLQLLTFYNLQQTRRRNALEHYDDVSYNCKLNAELCCMYVVMTLQEEKVGGQ